MKAPNGAVSTLLDWCATQVFPRKHIISRRHTAFSQMHLIDTRSYRLGKSSPRSRMLGAARCQLVRNGKARQPSVVRNGLVAMHAERSYLNGYAKLILDSMDALNKTQILFDLGHPAEACDETEAADVQ
jgi:hypothetical protein